MHADVTCNTLNLGRITLRETNLKIIPYVLCHFEIDDTINKNTRSLWTALDAMVIRNEQKNCSITALIPCKNDERLAELFKMNQYIQVLAHDY